MMTASLRIVLPVPPSANGMFRNAPGRGRVKTARYAEWRRVAEAAIAQQWREGGSPAIGKPWSLAIEVGFDRNRDITNAVKAVEDALVKALPGCPDDRWNDEATVARVDHVDPEIVIATLSWPAPPG